MGSTTWLTYSAIFSNTTTSETLSVFGGAGALGAAGFCAGAGAGSGSSSSAGAGGAGGAAGAAGAAGLVAGTLITLGAFAGLAAFPEPPFGTSTSGLLPFSSAASFFFSALASSFFC